MNDLDMFDLGAVDRGQHVELAAGSDASGPAMLDEEAARALRDWLTAWLGQCRFERMSGAKPPSAGPGDMETTP